MMAVLVSAASDANQFFLAFPLIGWESQEGELLGWETGR